MRVCVRMCVCMCVCACVCMCVCACVCVCACMRVCVCACVCACVHVWLKCMYTCKKQLEKMAVFISSTCSVHTVHADMRQKGETYRGGRRMDKQMNRGMDEQNDIERTY